MGKRLAGLAQRLVLFLRQLTFTKRASAVLPKMIGDPLRVKGFGKLFSGPARLRAVPLAKAWAVQLVVQLVVRLGLQQAPAKLRRFQQE
ncbi:MAG: hypothetical protein R2867_20820 [Caldilineaceae bacterium]